MSITVQELLGVKLFLYYLICLLFPKLKSTALAILVSQLFKAIAKLAEGIASPQLKNRQLSLPLTDTEQKLLSISLRHGDPTVYSREHLLSGREGWYSLNQRRTVFLPAQALTLLKEFDCSLEECEMVAM